MTVRHGLLAALLATTPVVAVTAAQVFRADVDTVLLSVTVTDGRSHPVAGLTRGDFAVLEDGVRQEISVFTADPQPIALSLLLDSSTSMEDKISMAKEGAVGFARRLGPNDVAQVIDFNSNIQIPQGFTGDVDRLEHAIRTIRTGGSTSLYTAMYVAISELRRVKTTTPDEIRRQAIIVLSDGEDTTSLKTYEDVAELARESDVAVYAIGLRDRDSGSNGRPSRSDFALRTLSQLTGGQVFFVDDARQLPVIYGQIADELASQYFIGYNTTNTNRDGAWRQVVVRVSRPETIVRTRAGYYGPSGRR